MKKIILCLVVIFTMIGFSGCVDDTADKESKYTEEVKQQSLDTVGLPDVSNFFEMSQLKEIYELRDNPKLNCYWYTKNNMSGKYIYMGKCIGYGIPYSTQITNPTQLEYSNSAGGTIDQAEPNGLYSTGSTSATWILSISSDGKTIEPIYAEEEILVTQNKLDKRLLEEFSIPDKY